MPMTQDTQTKSAPFHPKTMQRDPLSSQSPLESSSLSYHLRSSEAWSDLMRYQPLTNSLMSLIRQANNRRSSLMASG